MLTNVFFVHPLLTLTACGADLICLRTRPLLWARLSAEGDLAGGCEVQLECLLSNLLRLPHMMSHDDIRLIAPERTLLPLPCLVGIYYDS